MIFILAETAKLAGNSNTSFLMNLISTLVPVIVPAIISFIVAKWQSNVSSKHLEKQIAAEVEKVKIQYEYEQKRDNKNFLNKIFLENAFHLKDKFAFFWRNESKLAEDIYNIISDKRLNNQLIEERIKELYREHDTKHPYDFALLGNLFVYTPELDEKWNEIFNKGLKITNHLPKEIIRLFDEDPQYKLDSVIQNLRIEIDEFDLMASSLIIEIREKIKLTISSLEN